jgi:hypothetical protein
MSKDVEDRLRRALVSRAEQVTAESLRPAELPHLARSKRSWGTPGRSRWTTWRTPILAAAAAATVVAGLVLLDLGPDVGVSPADEPIVVTGSECARELELVTVALEDGGVSADVDGDGAPDRVATAVDGEASQKCRAFVAVRAATGSTYSTAMAAPAVPPPGVNADVIGVPDLGADGRADIVVDTHLMADGALAQLFTLTGDGLERVPAPAFEDGNFIVQGGGVTSPQAAGCTADGSLILSMATSDSRGEEYEVTRQIYPVTVTPLEFGGPRITTGHASTAELATRFPEFGANIFAPCGGELDEVKP